MMMMMMMMMMENDRSCGSEIVSIIATTITARTRIIAFVLAAKRVPQSISLFSVTCNYLRLFHHLKR